MMGAFGSTIMEEQYNDPNFVPVGGSSPDPAVDKLTLVVRYDPNRSAG